MFLCLVCPWYREHDHFRSVWENSLIRVSAHLTEDTKGRRSIHDQTTVAHERVLEAFPLIFHIIFTLLSLLSRFHHILRFIWTL